MSLIKRELKNWPVLSDFFADDFMNFRFENGDWLPAVNVVDNEKNYEVELAAPGFKKEDFSVSIENGVLYVKAKTEEKKEEKDKKYTRREFSSKSFMRTFTLPENVSHEDVTAHYEDGVLKLVLSKNEKALSEKKQIAIN